MAFGQAVMNVAGQRLDAPGEPSAPDISGSNFAHRCDVEYGGLQVRVPFCQRDGHHAGATAYIQHRAVLRQVQVFRQRCGVVLMKVIQHLGEVFGLSVVAHHRLGIARPLQPQDRPVTFSRRQRLLQHRERFEGLHAFVGVLSRPVDGPFGDEVFLRERRVPIGALRFVEQSQRDQRVQKCLEVELVDLERTPDGVRLHALSVEQAEDLQPLRGDDQARDDEGLLNVNIGQYCLGKLVERRSLHAASSGGMNADHSSKVSATPMGYETLQQFAEKLRKSRSLAD
jgi:hypothetical protein